jgi:hypothetical protein
MWDKDCRKENSWISRCHQELLIHEQLGPEFTPSGGAAHRIGCWYLRSQSDKRLPHTRLAHPSTLLLVGSAQHFFNAWYGIPFNLELPHACPLQSKGQNFSTLVQLNSQHVVKYWRHQSHNLVWLTKVVRLDLVNKNQAFYWHQSRSLRVS